MKSVPPFQCTRVHCDGQRHFVFICFKVIASIQFLPSTLLYTTYLYQKLQLYLLYYYSIYVPRVAGCQNGVVVVKYTYIVRTYKESFSSLGVCITYLTCHMPSTISWYQKFQMETMAQLTGLGLPRRNMHNCGESWSVQKSQLCLQLANSTRARDFSDQSRGQS